MRLIDALSNARAALEASFQDTKRLGECQKALADLLQAHADALVRPDPLCAVCQTGVPEYYAVTNEVWRDAGLAPPDHAHLRCVQQQLGRSLRPEDLSEFPVNRGLRSIWQMVDEGWAAWLGGYTASLIPVVVGATVVELAIESDYDIDDLAERVSESCANSLFEAQEEDRAAETSAQ